MRHTFGVTNRDSPVMANQGEWLSTEGRARIHEADCCREIPYAPANRSQVQRAVIASSQLRVSLTLSPSGA